MAGVNGLALSAVAAGSLFLYAAVKGKTVLGSVQAMVKGQPPSTAPAAAAASLSGSYGSSPSVDSLATGGSAVTDHTVPAGYGSAQQALQSAAKAYGWDTGTQWQALQSLELGEGGFNPQAVNSDSGAYGLAQALGHGDANTAGTAANEYGGFGLTDAQARAANSGDAGAQALWMANYIAATYGDPASAYKAWLSRNPHWY